jgi:hypothetical protein
MARIFRSQGRLIGRPLAVLRAVLFAVVTNAAAMAQLYDHPVLVVDPGMHNGMISIEELTAYVGDRLSQLTTGAQKLGLDLRFRGDIFVAGL